MDNNIKTRETGWVCKETTSISREIGWTQDILDGDGNVNGNSTSIKKYEKPSTTTATTDSSSDSSSSSDSCDSKDERRAARKLRKEEKREKRKEKRKIRKEEKTQKREIKKAKKEERKKLKKLKKLEKYSKNKDNETGSDCSIPIDLMVARATAPETPEEYATRQNRIRREIDPETGRSRLIKGDGEILEEIVSKERHLAINRQATKGDGEYFQSKTFGQKN